MEFEVSKYTIFTNYLHFQTINKFANYYSFLFRFLMFAI